MQNEEQFRVIPTIDKTPSFGIAAHRVLHACSRFESLKARLHDAANLWKSTIKFSVDREVGMATVILDQAAFLQDSESHAHDLSAIASEVVHHLRAALDHVAYTAAWADSGQRNEQAQFPIETRRKRWEKRANTMLKGVSAERLEWFYEAQPIGGRNKWAVQLMRLSNTDKHATRIELVPTLMASPDWDAVVGADPDRANAQIVRSKDPELDLLLYVPEPDRSIVTEPTPAIPLIWELIDSVRLIVNRFLVSEGLNPITVD